MIIRNEKNGYVFSGLLVWYVIINNCHVFLHVRFICMNLEFIWSKNYFSNEYKFLVFYIKQIYILGKIVFPISP